jgi:hypothetical protein
MPRKRRATKARILNLAKARKRREIYFGKSRFRNPSRQSPELLLPQTAVVDEPDTLDQNDVPTIPNEVDFVPFMESERSESERSESERSNDPSAESESESDGSSVEIVDNASDAEICEETELEKFSRFLHDAQQAALANEKANGNKRKNYKGDSRTTLYRRKRFRNDLAAKGFLPVHEFMKRMAEKKKINLSLRSQRKALTTMRHQCLNSGATGQATRGPMAQKSRDLHPMQAMSAAK